ncbi:hypothetical protein D043_3775B, partial [Vibrio parahaemolyticus EKP-021]
PLRFLRCQCNVLHASTFSSIHHFHNGAVVSVLISLNH